MISNKKEIKRKIEKAFNDGFKEYDKKEAFTNSNLVPLENGKIVDAMELKKNVNDLIDGIVSGDISSFDLKMSYGGVIEFSLNLTGSNDTFELRIGR